MYSVHLRTIEFARVKGFTQELISWFAEHCPRENEETIPPGVEIHAGPAAQQFTISFEDRNLALLFKLRFAGYEP